MHEQSLEGKRSPFFLLSVLLHLLFAFLCYQFISYHKAGQTAANSPLDVLKQLQGQERAEMKAAQSAFGAPVIFQEMPEFTPIETAEDTSDEDGAKEPAQLNHRDTVLSSAAQEDDPGATAPTEDTNTTALANEPSHEKYMPLEHTEAADPIKVATQSAAVEEKKEVAAHQVASSAQMTRPRQQKRIKRTVRQEKIIAAPTSKRLTFADLTNGFLENLKNGGKDAINQKGNPNKRPTYEDLKFVSYQRKMAWQLQAAFKQATGAQFMQPAPDRSQFTCTLCFGKDGNLQDIKILSGTGHQELDSYILHAIKNAFPFPPIPDHWQKDSLAMTWNFSNIHPQSHSYTVTF